MSNSKEGLNVIPLRNDERLLVAGVQIVCSIVQYNVAEVSDNVGLYISAVGFLIGSGAMAAAGVVVNKETLRSRLPNIESFTRTRLLSGSQIPKNPAQGDWVRGTIPPQVKGPGPQYNNFDC